MGGRALKSVETRRVSRLEFDKISKEIMDVLKLTFNKVGIPFFYNKKESFGDVDIIISKEGFNGNIREYIENTFKPNEIFHNGNAYSFDYDAVQIDLIFTPDKDFESTLNYMGGNDLGNFIGRLAQSIGLKYGQEGLWVNYYSDENTKDKIIVSKDYPKIFKFLGLDYSKWVEGFDTLEEIFQYTMTSPLFNPEMFQLHKLNKINRERNLKRASYMSFLEFLKNKAPHPEYNKTVVELSKENVIDVIREAFPEANIDLHLAEIAYKHARKVLIKRKFSGGILMEKYGLKGKDIGIAITEFKKFIEKYEVDGLTFDEFIIQNNYDYIYQRFDEFTYNFI